MRQSVVWKSIIQYERTTGCCCVSKYFPPRTQTSPLLTKRRRRRRREPENQWLNYLFTVCWELLNFASKSFSRRVRASIIFECGLGLSTMAKCRFRQVLFLWVFSRSETNLFNQYSLEIKLRGWKDFQLLGAAIKRSHRTYISLTRCTLYLQLAQLT